jgi:hypothetical protein
MWKKSVMGYFKVVYEYLICRTEEKPWELKVRTLTPRDDIQTPGEYDAGKLTIQSDVQSTA